MGGVVQCRAWAQHQNAARSATGPIFEVSFSGLRNCCNDVSMYDSTSLSSFTSTHFVFSVSQAR